MRSRDGSKPLLFGSYSIKKFLLFIFTFTSFTLWAQEEEYLISYRYVVKNGIVYNQSLDIAHAMQQCTTPPYNKTLTLESEPNQSLKTILHQHEEQFFQYLSFLGLDIQYTQETNNMQATSTTIVTLKTKCFKVDFNDYFVKITALK